MKTIVFSLIILNAGETYNLPASLSNVNIANYKLGDRAVHAIQTYTVSPAHLVAVKSGVDTITVMNANNDTTYIFPIKIR